MNYTISITKNEHSRLAEINFNDLPFGRHFTDHMFVVDYEQGEWKNPRIIPFSNLEMHPASMVLHYGQAIFEGMKAFKNQHDDVIFFRPEMHAKRLNESAARLCMPALPEELFLEGLQQLVLIDRDWIPTTADSSLYIRPFMIAKDGFIGVRPSQTYQFIIIIGPVGPYYAKPVKLHVEQEYVRAVKGGIGEAKAAGNYAASLLPAKLAQERGYDQVMWMEAPEFKYIQESGTMNIFFVIDGKVITPSTGAGILRGITRDSIITILKDQGYKVEERPISIDEIVAAHDAGVLQEAFGTGTAAVVSPIVEINFKGESLMLPPLETNVVAPLAKSIIEGMRKGTIEDKFGWIVPVMAMEEA
jgi:branched-chain amino acid aminotransferase